MAAQVLDQAQHFPCELGGSLDTHQGAPSRFRMAVINAIASVERAKDRCSGLREGSFRDGIDEHPRIGSHLAAPCKPATWTQSANLRRRFAAETLGEMAFASANFGLSRPQSPPARFAPPARAPRFASRASSPRFGGKPEKAPHAFHVMIFTSMSESLLPTVEVRYRFVLVRALEGCEHRRGVSTPEIF